LAWRRFDGVVVDVVVVVVVDVPGLVVGTGLVVEGGLVVKGVDGGVDVAAPRSTGAPPAGTTATTSIEASSHSRWW
jgi:hypothetical protein